MKFDLTLGVADKPGQLVRVLEPIARNGGNIVSIIHERETPSEGYVPVSLVADFPSHKNLSKAISDLRKIDIPIIRSEEIVERTRVTLLLIGRMDLRKIVETKIENVRVVGFEVSAPSAKESSVKIDLEVPVDSISKVIANLKKIAREEKSLLISSV